MQAYVLNAPFMKGNAVSWRADFSVDLFTGESVALRLLPDTVTLSDLQVDGKPATVLVEKDQFAAVLKEAGMETVTRFKLGRKIKAACGQLQAGYGEKAKR